jgi:hypothetical protein
MHVLLKFCNNSVNLSEICVCMTECGKDKKGTEDYTALAILLRWARKPDGGLQEILQFITVNRHNILL